MDFFHLKFWTIYYYCKKLSSLQRLF